MPQVYELISVECAHIPSETYNFKITSYTFGAFLTSSLVVRLSTQSSKQEVHASIPYYVPFLALSMLINTLLGLDYSSSSHTIVASFFFGMFSSIVFQQIGSTQRTIIMIF